MKLLLHTTHTHMHTPLVPVPRSSLRRSYYRPGACTAPGTCILGLDEICVLAEVHSRLSCRSSKREIISFSPWPPLFTVSFCHSMIRLAWASPPRCGPSGTTCGSTSLLPANLSPAPLQGLGWPGGSTRPSPLGEAWGEGVIGWKLTLCTIMLVESVV